jgi:hypothetical protein
LPLVANTSSSSKKATLNHVQSAYQPIKASIPRLNTKLTQVLGSSSKKSIDHQRNTQERLQQIYKTTVGYDYKTIMKPVRPNSVMKSTDEKMYNLTKPQLTTIDTVKINLSLPWLKSASPPLKVKKHNFNAQSSEQKRPNWYQEGILNMNAFND